MKRHTKSGWRAVSGVIAVGLAALGFRTPAVPAGEFTIQPLVAYITSPGSEQGAKSIGGAAASESAGLRDRQSSKTDSHSRGRRDSIDKETVTRVDERRVLRVGRILSATAVATKQGPAATRAAGTLGPGAPCSCDQDCDAGLGDQCNSVQCIVRSTCTGDGTTPCSANSHCTDNGTCNMAAGSFIQRCDTVQLVDWPCDADGDFCTLDRCKDDGSGGGTSTCTPQDDGAGGALSPCAKHCVGGPAAFLQCDRASDCPQGSCQIIPGGQCDSAVEACYVGGSLAAAVGRCCNSGACTETDEATCAVGGGDWYRYRSPDEQQGDGNCLCPKYGSGVAPPGPDLGSIGLVRPSGLVCQVGSVQTGTEVYCEDVDGDGLSPNFCLRRCVGGAFAGEPCTVDNPDCAGLGVCDQTGDLCVVVLEGADCPDPPAGQICAPLISGTCEDDACGSNGIQGGCEDGFLSIGDDYDIANGSFQRLTQFRFRGGVSNLGEDIEIEFWDSTGTKFVDGFAIPNLPITGTHDWTIEVDCWPNCNPNQGEVPDQKPIIIPPVGWVVMRSTRTVGTISGAAAFWSQTDSQADVGANDVSKMWVDGDPLASLGTNVMIFELVGVKVPTPLGACCDDALTCEDTLRWECGICSETDPPVLCADTLHDCPGGGLNGSVCRFTRWFGPISHTDFIFGAPETTLCNGVAPCNLGACCDGESCLELAEAECNAAGGDFLGIATDCTPNCCRAANPTGSDCACATGTCVEIALSCLGGADDGSACATDADCAVTDPADPGECGNLNLGFVGLFCESDLDCEAGVATCVLQCEPNGVTQLRHPYECHDDFGGPLAPGVACDPANGDADCTPIDPLYTCEQSFSTSTTTTRSGTIASTFAAPDGDICTLNAASDPVGWYELFELEDPTPGDGTDDCFILTIGLCCTDPVLLPIWPFVSRFLDCPCRGSSDVEAIPPDASGFVFTADGFGPTCLSNHCCEDDNYSMTVTLPPGEYAYQINADTRCAGSTTPCFLDDDCPGTACVVPDPDYTVHFTVESCAVDACCVGDTCITTNALDCAAQSGTFLSGTHRDHPVMGCQAEVCSLGSCCLLGQCRDDAAADTLAECDALGGVYLGGVTCDLGPCPACPFDGPANCQQVQTVLGPWPLMDRNPQNGESDDDFASVLADDVKFGGSEVDQICWNTRFFGSPMGGGCVQNVDTTWEIRIYETDPACNALPAAQVGMSTITVLNKLEGVGQPTATWHYSGSLDTPIALPNGGFTGDTYWFEVSGFGEPGCAIRAIWSRDDGNGHSASAHIASPNDPRDYGLDGVDDVDVGFCEDSGIMNPGEVLGTCCKCPANCIENWTQRECDAMHGVWSACATCAETLCPGVPDNDNCESPYLVSNVPESFDGTVVLTISDQNNICATDDGPGLGSGNSGCAASLGGGADMHNDVWYAYTPTTCGDLQIESCGAANMDQMIAVYDADDGCPLTEAEEIGCADDACGINEGPAFVVVGVRVGHEYLIRVGGWNNEVAGGFVGDPRGTFSMDWSLTPTHCFGVEPLIPAAPPHDILKNRYISIDPRGQFGLYPTNSHIRVVVASSQVPGLTGSGPWWATAPVDGQPPSPATCISVLSSTKPGSAPDWSGCPALHLTGCPIVPTTTYIIQAEVDGDLAVTEARFDTQAKPDAKWHGDCVGFFDGEQWTPPNGNVNIDDGVAAIKTFQDPTRTFGCGSPPCNSTHLSVTDVHPNLNGAQINRVVNIGDVFVILLGFQGFEYPGTQIELCP